MKRLIALGLLGGLVACSPTDKSDTPVALETEGAKFSYALGMDVGKSFVAIGVEIDEDAFVEAFKARLASAEMRLTDQEATTVLQAMAKKKQAEALAEREALAAKNKGEGDAYLAENKKKEGVTTTASGLQYEVLKAAKGVQPTAENTVKVHYRGTLIDGTEFDSSYSRNEPATFPLNGVIKGWTEGVQLMNVGSKFRFVVPFDLAYGAAGRPGIPPSSTLIFEVELLEIMSAEKPAAVK